MAATTEIPGVATPPETKAASHEFHAEAHVLSGDLKRPVEQKIEQHAPVALKGRRSSHLTRVIDDVSIEGLITFEKGHTRVSGSKRPDDSKKDPKLHGWVTLSTSVVEGLNVFEVITADRIVSQVSTDHPLVDGHFPFVTFLGTQFDNLRVSGVPVKLTLNFGICGNRAQDRSYLDDLKFLNDAKNQIEKITANANDLSEDVRTNYSDKLAQINQLIKNGGSKGSREPKITCSLVTSIDKKIEEEIPGVKVFGHVLVIPHFGTVSLGEVEVGEKKDDPSEERPSNYFTLTTIQMNLGCLGNGSVTAATVTANGHTKP